MDMNGFAGMALVTQFLHQLWSSGENYTNSSLPDHDSFPQMGGLIFNRSNLLKNVSSIHTTTVPKEDISNLATTLWPNLRSPYSSVPPSSPIFITVRPFIELLPKTEPKLPILVPTNDLSNLSNTTTTTQYLSIFLSTSKTTSLMTSSIPNTTVSSSTTQPTIATSFMTSNHNEKSSSTSSSNSISSSMTTSSTFSSSTNVLTTSSTVTSLEPKISVPTSTINFSTEIFQTKSTVIGGFEPETSTIPGLVSNSTFNPFKPDEIRNCRSLSDLDLYQLLDDAGEYNQGFMGDRPEDVDRFLRGHSAKLDDDPLVEGVGVEGVRMQKIKGFSCGYFCQKLKRALNEAKSRIQNDALSHENTDFKKGQNDKCEFANFFPIFGDCDNYDQSKVGGNSQNSIADRHAGYEKLCSTCKGVYQLSPHCFPQFFSAAKCAGSDRCIFDLWGRGHGQCQERTMSFLVLSNVGSPQCQRWVFQHVNVPTACECFLDKQSILRARIKR